MERENGDAVLQNQYGPAEAEKRPEDFYALAKETHVTNERIWRMIITDMLFNYDEHGFLEAETTDNGIKRKQFAIIANVIMGKLRADR